MVEKLVNFQNSILGIDNADQAKTIDNDGNEDTSDEEYSGLQLNRAPIKTPEVNESSEVAINNIPIVSYPPKASRSSTIADKNSSLSGTYFLLLWCLIYVLARSRYLFFGL